MWKSPGGICNQFLLLYRLLLLNAPSTDAGINHGNAAVMSSQQMLLSWQVIHQWHERIVSSIHPRSSVEEIKLSLLLLASILSLPAFKHLIGLTSRFDSEGSEPPISGWCEISYTDLTKSVWRPKVRWIPGGEGALLRWSLGKKKHSAAAGQLPDDDHNTAGSLGTRGKKL